MPVAVFALLVLGCGTSLTDGEWLWCQDDSNRVASAARALGLARDPGWWSRCTATGDTSLGTGDVYNQLLAGAHDYYACAAADSEYIAACRVVARANGGPAVSGAVLSTAEISFCEKDPYWTATRTQSLSMGQRWFESTTGTPSWVMRGVAVENLRADSDYVRACKSAFKQRSD
jgi:hypothetical protein